MRRPVRPMAGLVILGLVAAGAARGQTCMASTIATAFGIYEPFNPLPSDTAGSVNIRCSNGPLIALLVSFNVSLTPGSGGTYAARSMASGVRRLDYQLYRNLLRTEIWGDGTGGSLSRSDTALVSIGAVERIYPVYGRIPARQVAVPGTYADTVVVLVVY